jgi:pimeloyl-ACP methyl ester carboxylesterase
MANGKKSKRVSIILLVVALFLILVGDLLASAIQTDFGKVKVTDVRFVVGTDGTEMNALLYVPKNATAQNPAPGILCIHGYLNNSGTQDGFAIEFARRGYVALAIDQTGHGYSAPPALANNFGGPDGLQYLLSRDYVDKNNIGLEGHSMGGWAVVQTAKAFPNDYKALVMEDSNFGTITSTFPRNLCFVVAKCGEFSQSWWGVPAAKDVGTSASIKKAFGVSEDVVPSKLYGSIADGTARELFLIPTTHPGIHISTQAIGDTVAWFQATLQGGNNLPPSNQIWLWKEIGNLIAIIGMFLLFFPVGSLLLRANFFKDIEEAPAEKPKSAKGVAWWISALIIVVVPPLTYLTFVEYATKFKLAPNQLFPQTFTAQFMIWLLLVGVIGLVLFLIWHFAFNRKAQASAADYGLTWGSGIGWTKIGKAFLLGFIVVLAGYVTLALSWWLFNVDFRFWVFNIKPMSLIQFRMFLSYLIPFLVYFVILGLILNGQLRPTRKGTEMNMASEMVINVVLLVLGFIGFLAYQYIPLLMGGKLSIGSSSDNILFTIMAFQLLPIFTIVALVYTYFFRKTALIYTGVMLSALLVTWILVASQPAFVAL